MTGLRTATNQVTVIGTGAIGSAVTRRLLTSGRAVVVWNRTASRSVELVEAGAGSAESVAAAVSASPLTLLTLTDYVAVRQCLDQLHSNLAGRTVVVLCTGTADDARRSAEQITTLGGRYLDAGVQTSPEMIGTDTATILYSGARDAFEEHRTTLDLLSRARFVGTEPDAAAIWDLTLFGIWYDAQLGLLRALDIARTAGLDVTELARTAAIQLGHVVDSADETASELLRGEYPRGPADLTEHLPVLRHLIALRSGRPLGEGGLTEVVERVEVLIGTDRGGAGLTATIG